MQHFNKFSIPAFRRFVADKLRPWIIVLFVIVFQFSGGIYLASVAQMVGSLSLMQEDIMMAGYASMAGMALVFTIMFRLRFRFSTKIALMTCCTGILLCTLICMHTSSVPLLVVACFVAGFLRMWGTFTCNTIIQLWITPTRDLSIFFCYIYFVVQCAIQFSGLLTTHTAYFAGWEYMHLVVIGLLLCVMLAVMTLLRSHRDIKKLPLYGIDWMGGLLWGITLLLVQFVCIYGDHYDWFQSVYIRAASMVAVIITALNLWRSSYIRHPYIALSTWRFPVVYLTAGGYLLVFILLAPSHIFEHIYIEGILGYDSLNFISLNWVSLAAFILDCLFTWQTFARRKCRYRTMNLIALCCIAVHLMLFYFQIDFNQSKQSLLLPIFLRSFGYVIIRITFLTSLARLSWLNFPQALSVQAFVSAGFGSLLGTAIVSHALKYGMKSNAFF